jgi:acetyl esterase/lipase
MATMKIFFLPIITMSFFSTLSSSGQTYPAEQKTNLPESIYNVSYGSDPQQKLDIFLPSSATGDPAPVIIVIHGGGWNSGSKDDFMTYIDSFRKRMPGFAIFNLNYRLFNGKNIFPAQEDDIRLAVKFITSKAGEYQTNTSKLVLLGASAGAHLALLQAYKYKDPQIAAVIDFFGPSDLVSMYEKPWHPFVPHALEMVTGSTLSSNRQLYTNSSPVTYVNAGSPPTLIFHGSNDPVVDVSQSRILNNKLEAAGVTHELVIYPGQRHGWYGKTLSNSFDIIEKFLHKHLGQWNNRTRNME